MKSQMFSSVLAWVACTGMLIPTSAFASTPTVSQPIVDIELDGHNALRGHVYDRQGSPRANEQVTLTAETVSMTANTDSKGEFVFENLQGGTYHLSASAAAQTIRVWKNQTAPPAATAQAMLVNSDSVVRGQYEGYPGGACDPGYGGCPPTGGGRFHWLANPWVIGAIVAVAVAVPVALSDDDDGNAS